MVAEKIIANLLIKKFTKTSGFYSAWRFISDRSSTKFDGLMLHQKGNDVLTGKEAHASKVDDAINLLGAASIIGGPYGAVFGAAVIGTHAIDNMLDGFLSDLPDALSDNVEKKADILTDAMQKKQLEKNQEEHDAKRKAKETIIVDGKVVQSPGVKVGMDDCYSGNIPEDIKKSIEYDMSKSEMRNRKVAEKQN